MNRIKSLAWRLGGAMVLSGLAFLIDYVAKLEIDPWLLTTISGGLGYITGEITKWWAIHQADFGKTFFGRVK